MPTPEAVYHGNVIDVPAIDIPVAYNDSLLPNKSCKRKSGRVRISNTYYLIFNTE